MENKIFITKDAVFRGYLPIYGNSFWKGQTPNIDELASKGNVFKNHYAAAPSTIMSSMCMCTGLFSHESELDRLYTSHLRFSGETIFVKAEELGYECHIIWDIKRKTKFKAEEKYYCYGEDTKIHYAPDLSQSVGTHQSYNGTLQRDDKKTDIALRNIENEIKSILVEAKKPVFIWFHVPHVINGRTGYGQDFDVFDKVIGIARKYFDDNGIYISADHGNMNGVRGKVCYGFDVYQPSVLIPFISPRIDDKKTTDELTCNIDIDKIILHNQVPKRELVYSDSAFYAQPQRKLALINERFKYIFNKQDHSEELYDLIYDPNETCNIINDFIYDPDRKIDTPLRELYFYPYWVEAEEARVYFREEKNKIWKEGSFKQEFTPRAKFWIQSHGYHKLKKLLNKKK
jgi:arylsulfatase A-like enzyme